MIFLSAETPYFLFVRKPNDSLSLIYNGGKL